MLTAVVELQSGDLVANGFVGNFGLGRWNGTSWVGIDGSGNANALAALSAARAYGLSLQAGAKALEGFSGTKRRLEVVGKTASVTVIDDFAHNPDKIAATLETLRAQPGRLLIMFQPHGYGPLAKMGEPLAESIADGMAPDDRLYLPDPVYQGGTVDKSRGSDWLAEEVGRHSKRAEHIPERARIGDALVEEARPGDRILIMGARDDTLIEFARSLVDRLAETATA